MKKALIVAAAIVLLIGVAGLTRPGGAWDGHVSRQIKIQIKSADGRSIPGAFVLLIQRWDSLTKQRSKEEVLEDYLNNTKSSIISDESGTVELVEDFGAGGGFGPHGRTGHFIVTGDIFVLHNEYLDFRAPLSDLVGERRVSLEKKELGFTVFLKPK